MTYANGEILFKIRKIVGLKIDYQNKKIKKIRLKNGNLYLFLISKSHSTINLSSLTMKTQSKNTPHLNTLWS
jgi:hypothetical protein